jgi:hypothetical protein
VEISAVTSAPTSAWVGLTCLPSFLEAKDRSSKKEVKQVKPTHADVGAEVTAEISTGPYRFVYRKRFHKRCETELTILAPRREQLTGDDAHDRVRAMLDETVDTCLWQAQRVLQASSTESVDLSGCDALSRALDVAAGEAVELSGAEPLLIDRVEGEYQRYFTKTGRPTGEWAAATNRLKQAEEQVAAAAITGLEAAVAAAAEEQQTGAAVAEEAETAAENARKALEDSQSRVEAARRSVQQLADREEADRIAGWRRCAPSSRRSR